MKNINDNNYDWEKRGEIPKNYEIEIPTKSKTSTPKPKPQSTSKKTVKNSTKKKPNTQVCRNSKGKIVACKKCVPAPWMTVALKEAQKVKGRKKWAIS